MIKHQVKPEDNTTISY